MSPTQVPSVQVGQQIKDRESGEILRVIGIAGDQIFYANGAADGEVKAAALIKDFEVLPMLSSGPAGRLGGRLREAGFEVQSSSEADEQVDGQVTISERVHVSVHVFSPDMSVVRETPKGNFMFYPPKADLAGTAADLRQAIADDKVETLLATIADFVSEHDDWQAGTIEDATPEVRAQLEVWFESVKGFENEGAKPAVETLAEFVRLVDAGAMSWREDGESLEDALYEEAKACIQALEPAASATVAKKSGMNL